jgi:hypothetical protein
MKSITKALVLSRQANAFLKEEIDRHKSGAGIVGVATQLVECQNQIEEMIVQLESGHLPPKNQRLRGMGHMIADSWPINSQLGDALLLAEQAYHIAET